jgi:hypothetical protein
LALTSQSRTVPSSPAEAMTLLFGAYVADQTPDRWPCNTATSVFLRRSHSFMVESSLAEPKSCHPGLLQVH